MRYWLRHITSWNWVVSSLLITLAIALWAPTFLSLDLSQAAEYLPTVYTIVLTAVNATLLIFILYEVGITHSRIGFPLFLYIFLTATVPVLQTNWQSQLIVLVCQIVILLISQSYRNPYATEQAFLSGLLLSMTTLFLPDSIFIVPIVWIALWWQRALSLRTWLASIIGIAAVALYAFIAYFLNIIDIYPLSYIVERELIDLENLYQGFVQIFLWGVFYSIMLFSRFSREANKAQSYLFIVVLLLLFSAITAVIPSANFASVSALAVYSIAALATYYHHSQKTEFAGSIFLLLVASFLAAYILNIFI